MRTTDCRVEAQRRIKNLIVDTLDPYFEDKEFLKEKAIDSLSAEAANVGKIGQDAKAEKWLRQLLEIHRQARKVNEKTCFQTIGYWEQAIEHGRSEFWRTCAFFILQMLLRRKDSRLNGWK